MLALITSSSQRRLGAGTQFFPIDISTKKGEQTGLKVDSVVQCENLLTYEKSLILRVLGKLSESEMIQIDRCLEATLGIKKVQ
ncbi:MAG: type II toxin-antitoxin system PemK/MazF family toxin [Trueperaceae bacterium]